jgi:hypothetical protein
VVAGVTEELTLLKRLCRQLQARLDASIARAVVNLVNDRLKTQRVQLTILEGENEDHVEHLQPYGLSFVPPAGSEALALAVGGTRAHTVAVCVEHPDERPVGGDPRTGGLYTKGLYRFYIDADGVTCTGAMDSSQHHVAGDELVSALAQLTVPTSMGPSGTPLNAAAIKAALSRHKVEK